MHVNKRIRLGRPKAGYRIAARSAPGQSILQSLLFELAAVLLPRGVTPAGFNEIAKHAFIEAAASISKFRNGRVNQSKVSVLTGLRRGEVRRLLSHAGCLLQSDIRHQSPIETVVAGWCTDRRYVNRDGSPKRLTISGTKGPFALLVKQYAGDVPPRAVLSELGRLGIARQIGHYAELQNPSAVRQRQDFAALDYLMPAIIDGIRLASNAGARVRSSSMRRLVLPAHNLLDLEMVRERCTSSIESMLQGLSESVGTRRMASRRANQMPHSCAVTVLFVENKSLPRAYPIT
jgi:hypothetical protein